MLLSVAVARAAISRCNCEGILRLKRPENSFVDVIPFSLQTSRNTFNECLNSLHQIKGSDSLTSTAHRKYKRLGKTKASRQLAYKTLFLTYMPEKTLATIREATNKAWVPGDAKFKKRVEKKLHRKVETSGHGGDRKSDSYQQNNQRV